MSFDLDGYKTVAERCVEFFAKHPHGTLSSELTRLEDGWLCKAFAYRTPDDPQPGMGHAFEPVPGKTPYTRDSEAMNAETSAWGRAIIAAGIPSEKIASQDEVRARSAAAPSPVAAGNGAKEAAVEHTAEGAPAAAPDFVAKAQAAAAANRPARPDIPTATDRTTPRGDTLYTARTFVKPKAQKPLQDGRTSYLFTVVLDGAEVEMSTLSQQTADQASKLADTTVDVEWVENGRFKNLWRVTPVEAVEEAFAGANMDGIPFAPVIW